MNKEIEKTEKNKILSKEKVIKCEHKNNNNNNHNDNGANNHTVAAAATKLNFLLQRKNKLVNTNSNKICYAPVALVF